MNIKEYLDLTGKSPLDHPTYADLIGIAQEKPPVDEVAEARAKKRAELAAQIKAIDSGEALPAPTPAPAPAAAPAASPVTQ
jgi:hypothetical protein